VGFPVLVFRVKGQFAHWRKWFTTTSPLTYSFPPRTAILGLVGAIAGVQRDEIPEKFPLQATKISVCPLTRIVKDRLPETWYWSPVRIVDGEIQLGEKKEAIKTFQVNLEVIRYPYYRIIFWHEDEKLMAELAARLREKRWFYPPCLGIMGFLADIEFEGEDEAEEAEGGKIELNSILPLDEDSPLLELNPSGNYIREERLPLEVFPGRQFDYLRVAYIESSAQPLSLKVKEGVMKYALLKKSGFRIMFFEQAGR